MKARILRLKKVDQQMVYSSTVGLSEEDDGDSVGMLAGLLL